jgi:hypothetical protein
MSFVAPPSACSFMFVFFFICFSGCVKYGGERLYLLIFHGLGSASHCATIRAIDHSDTILQKFPSTADFLQITFLRRFSSIIFPLHRGTCAMSIFSSFYAPFCVISLALAPSSSNLISLGIFTNGSINYQNYIK